MTDRYEHIACFVDESDASRRAAAEAARLRDRLGAERLTLVHLLAPPLYFGVYYPPPEPEPGTPAWLQALAAEIGDAGTVTIDSIAAYPPAEAVRWAGDEGVDLMVAASHRGVFKRLVLGSFASYLAYHARCPVLLVPPATPPHDGQAAEAAAEAAAAG